MEAVVQDRQSIDADPIDLVESATSTTQNALKAAESALAAVKAAQDVLDHKDFSHVKFLNTIGHELRSPLASILGYAQMLRDELDDTLSRQHQEFFKTILTNVKLSLGLVNDLSTFVRLDAGNIELDMKPVALQSIIGEIVHQLHGFAEEKGILLSADLPMEEYYVNADEKLLRLVIHNMVSNAIRYTDDGSVTVYVLQATGPAQDAYQIEIIDTGRGIKEHVLDACQTIPTREKRMAYLMEEGVSISLAVALEHTLTLDGTVAVRSDIGKGAVYTLSFNRALLPAREPVTEEATTTSEPPPTQPPIDPALDGGSW